MTIKPIKTDRLSDKIIKHIISLIKEGTLKPGDKLPNETDLSEQLEVSRGILREALTQMQSQGIITRKPKDGTYVTEDVFFRLRKQELFELINTATYLDLLDFRESLELRMVERVIERAKDKDIDHLLDGLTDPIENEKEETQKDHYFHYNLAKMSGNIFYMDFINTYYDLLRDIKKKTISENKRSLNDIRNEHLEIAKAIKERNKEAARKAIEEHFSKVYSSLQDNW